MSWNWDGWETWELAPISWTYEEYEYMRKQKNILEVRSYPTEPRSKTQFIPSVLLQANVYNQHRPVHENKTNDY